MTGSNPPTGLRKRFRVAIVGAGLMGGWHARYARRVGARVDTVIDADIRHAEALARHVGGRAVSAHAPWLEQPPDVAHVCIPLAARADLVDRLLAAGSHVIVEKPLAATGAEARRLLDLAAAADRQIVPVHQLPFQHGIGHLRRNLHRVGSVGLVAYRTDTAGGNGFAPAERRALLREILPHPVSLLFALGFDRLPASAWRIVHADNDALHLVAVSGATRLSIAIDLELRPTRNELEVTGSRGTALADLFHGSSIIDTAALGRPSKLLRPFRVAGRSTAASGLNLVRRVLRIEPAYPGLVRLLGRFYRGLAEGLPPPICSEEIIAAAELMGHVETIAEPAELEGPIDTKRYASPKPRRS